MRLLHVRTLTFREFFDANRPEYAILSHRWHNDEEVSYQEMMDPGPRTREKAGYQKITNCCRKAIVFGLEYVWIDTCCIDSRSSAELTESINSMYRWYQESEICFAFLADVTTVIEGTRDHSSDRYGEFSRSVWFTRGWTLQELLAPRNVLFFSQDWKAIGSRNKLSKILSNATGIRVGIIAGVIRIETTSIAERMSWASKRTTTRAEDMAYCLLGLFDINMPMLYGEGSKAFIRLQEEILKSSKDHTIFVWRSQPGADEVSGLLAPHPSCFSTTGGFVPDYSASSAESLIVSPTNIGLQLDVLFSSVGNNDEECESRAILPCKLLESNFRDSCYAAIILRPLDAAKKEYCRRPPEFLGYGRLPPGTPRRIYVPNNPLNAFPSLLLPKWIRVLPIKHSTSPYRYTRCLVGSGVQAVLRDPQSERLRPFRTEQPRQISSEDIHRYTYSFPHSSYRPAIVLQCSKSNPRGAEDAFQFVLGTDCDGQLATRLSLGERGWDAARSGKKDFELPDKRSELPHISYELSHGEKLVVWYQTLRDQIPDVSPNVVNPSRRDVQITEITVTLVSESSPRAERLRNGLSKVERSLSKVEKALPSLRGRKQ